MDDAENVGATLVAAHGNENQLMYYNHVTPTGLSLR
jgi:hypothetical protein